MNKDEVSLLDHISSLRSSHSEAGVSVVLYAGKARLETDMPNVSCVRLLSAYTDSVICDVFLAKQVLSLHRKVGAFSG